jgi:hypothetical protein
MAGKLSHVEGNKKGRAHGAPYRVAGLDRAAAGQQVVDDPDDCQHQQKEDQRTPDVQGEPEQPENEEDDNHGPNQPDHYHDLPNEYRAK